jgi:hypothetical protein
MGWNEPLSLDGGGRISVGIPARWCVFDALEDAAGAAVDALMAADEVLFELVRPSGLSVSAWLAAPGRSHLEVLQLLARGIARARIQEGR